MDGTEGGRKEVARLLGERGVSGAGALVAALCEDDAGVEAALATIRYYDDQHLQGSGLLVYLLRKGEKADYKRPDERESAPPSAITPTLLKAIRGACHSPDGYTRDDARGMLATKAKRMGLAPDVLIDAAMGSEWMETPRHPALSREGTQQERDRRYAAWVNEEKGISCTSKETASPSAEQPSSGLTRFAMPELPSSNASGPAR